MRFWTKTTTAVEESPKVEEPPKVEESPKVTFVNDFTFFSILTTHKSTLSVRQMYFKMQMIEKLSE
jgi:hypothetical protein